ncbi:fungal-specific transcription factor domain-containing protein [Aspergillus bertholletiae]|uniref:Fungal-specific transcription factor domain-containing protein n=1 Tax=Aspergillus bertholletiae TaxID=1226010 RepID=A0A5N7BKW2_9EURO|nr:fungal-specific transcription factor domain-containing protein [Aspergillus bertholletiae]
MAGRASYEHRTPRKRNVACTRCHAQKTKCTGDKPCAKCREAGVGDQCRYVSRDRKIRINESYLEQLLDENQRLLQEKSQRQDQHLDGIGETSRSQNQGVLPNHNPDIPNPLMRDNVWLRPRNSPSFSMYIGEATSAAFAGLLHQCLTGSSDPILTDQEAYTGDSVLKSLMDTTVPWPSQAQACLLVKIALNHLDPVFYSLLGGEIMQQIQDIYSTSNFNDPITKCKLFALFALGEAFSSPGADKTGAPVPGTAYYARAMACIVIMPERPSVTLIESLLLLALFCQFLNRWHSAYGLLGNALRLAMSMGLGHNLPPHPDICAAKRQHRIRLWWAIYIFDRFWSLKLSLPFQIQDDDIYVDMPCGWNDDDQPPADTKTVSFVASLRLAKIVGDITTRIYRRRQSGMGFLQRAQHVLRELKQWAQSLPPEIELHSGSRHQAQITTLHLQFYYCVIIATRPVIMYALMLVLKSRPQDTYPAGPGNLPSAIVTISKACQDAARQIYRIVVDEWTRGSVPVHGYSHPQFLFCATLILSASSLLPFGSQTDFAAIETSIEIFRTLRERGNLATTGLGECVERIHQCILNRISSGGPPHGTPDVNAPPMPPTTHSMHHCIRGSEDRDSLGLTPRISSSTFLDMATEISLSETETHDFLAQSGLDVGSMDHVYIGDFDFPLLYSHLPSLP